MQHSNDAEIVWGFQKTLSHLVASDDTVTYCIKTVCTVTSKTSEVMTVVSTT